VSFKLPELPYAYDALAPHMSKETLEFHHDKHHLAYVNTGNGLIEGTDYASLSLTKIVKKAYAEKNQALINQAGQHYNHYHFWNWMKPNGGGTKLPGIVMPNDIPFDGEPADNHELVAFYSDWLKHSDVPKLFVNADEGHGLAGAAREFARTFKNQTEVTVHARHYLQEDAPDEVGAAIGEFVRRLRA